MIIDRKYLVGSFVGAAILAVALGAWWSYNTYKEGQELHRQAKEAVIVLFQAVDEKFIIKDKQGIERPATVAEVLMLVARERVRQIQQQQQLQPPVPNGK